MKNLLTFSNTKYYRMFKEAYHPKAFLVHKKNVRRGLIARSKIVLILEIDAVNIRKLSENTGLKYPSVLYHLRSLENEHIVVRGFKKPYTWQLSGVGQQTLTDN